MPTRCSVILCEVCKPQMNVAFETPLNLDPHHRAQVLDNATRHIYC